MSNEEIDFAGWKRFVRRDDPTDAYWARKTGHGYELMRPGEEMPSIRIPKEAFLNIYEPEQQRSEGGDVG